jgi:hypothetical protein
MPPTRFCVYCTISPNRNAKAASETSEFLVLFSGLSYMFGLARLVGITVLMMGLVNAVAEEEELYAVVEEEDTGGREYLEDGGVFGSEPDGEAEGREEVERMESLGWTTACPEAYIQNQTLSLFLFYFMILEMKSGDLQSMWWRLNLSWHAR